MRDPRFACIPKVIETPKAKDLAEDKVNLGILRELAAGGVPGLGRGYE